MEIAEQLIGIWDLVKWEARQTDGEIFYPFGEDALGQLLYDANGNMMVEVMRQDRPHFASGNFMEGTTDEILSACHGFMGYCGTYHIDLESMAVIHRIRIASFPNWVGQDQVRYYSFHDGLLTLHIAAIGTTEHDFTWRKRS